jgi:glycosyltransferase involved in cell wall biosynthesis
MIACVLHVRNEEFFLPGFLDSVRDHVDAFYCLDDGSTDATVQIVEKEGKLKLLVKKPPRTGVGWSEQPDLERLYEAVKNDGYDWILTADPDERLSVGFLERMRVLTAMPLTPVVYVLKLCECWDSADHYRTDGVWGTKIKSVLFSVPEKIAMSDQRYHAPNYPLELYGCEVLLTDRVYHLKMVRPEDRKARRDLYNAVDPECRFQQIGYDYLADHDGLVLTRIPESHEYDYRTLPESWKNTEYLSGGSCEKSLLAPHTAARRGLETSGRDLSLSVIVASYNYGRFLTDAVESVLDQTVLPGEILIIDDCSQDNTLEIGEHYARKYPGLVRYHRNVRNLGTVQSFCTAVSMTGGELVCVLGADNRLRRDYLEKTSGVLKSNPEVAVAYTDYVLFGSEAGHVYAMFPEAWRGARENGFRAIHFPEFDAEELEKGNYIHGSSLYRRAAYEEAGGYVSDGNPDDYSLFLRMVHSGWKAKKTGGTVLEYRHHSKNQVNRQRSRIEALELEVSRLKTDFDLVTNSRSWKITQPIRAVTARIRSVLGKRVLW